MRSIWVSSTIGCRPGAAGSFPAPTKSPLLLKDGLILFSRPQDNSVFSFDKWPLPVRASGGPLSCTGKKAVKEPARGGRFRISPPSGLPPFKWPKGISPLDFPRIAATLFVEIITQNRGTVRRSTSAPAGQARCWCRLKALYCKRQACCALSHEHLRSKIQTMN